MRSLVDFALNGFVKSDELDRRSLDFTLDEVRADGEGKAKEVILMAAEKLMGRRDISVHRYMISRVRRATVGGTFYLHFESKEVTSKSLFIRRTGI